MTDTANELRTVSDTLLSNLDLLGTLEEEKRRLDPADPRLAELAAEIERIAAMVLDVSARQRELTERVVELVEREPEAAPTVPIEEIPPRDIPAILEDWRDAERRVASAQPGSLEARTARADIDRLRGEYQRAHQTRVGLGG